MPVPPRPLAAPQQFTSQQPSLQQAAPAQFGQQQPMQYNRSLQQPPPVQFSQPQYQSVSAPPAFQAPLTYRAAAPTVAPTNQHHHHHTHHVHHHVDRPVYVERERVVEREKVYGMEVRYLSGNTPSEPDNMFPYHDPDPSTGTAWAGHFMKERDYRTQEIYNNHFMENFDNSYY